MPKKIKEPKHYWNPWNVDAKGTRCTTVCESEGFVACGAAKVFFFIAIFHLMHFRFPVVIPLAIANGDGLGLILGTSVMNRHLLILKIQIAKIATKKNKKNL